MTDNKAHEDRSYDAVIVGAGVIGLACAWRAARAGLSVCVLERDRVGSGATGVAAGMLAPVGEASWGEEALLELGLASLQGWDDFAAELDADAGSPAGFLRCGAVHVALDRDEAESLGRRHELHRRLGLDSSRLRPSDARDLEPGLSTAVTAALHAPHEAAADPQLLSAALARAVRKRGGEIEEGTEVVSTEVAEGGPAVRLADGRGFRGRGLVVATGCWSGSADWLPASLRPPVRPVKGEVLTLLAGHGGPPCKRILASERVYIVPRDDGRLVVGATVTERGFDAAVTAGGVHELLREAYRLLPEVAELELLEARAGLRPGTPDNSPIIGEPTRGLILATGHYRNGVLLAPVTAEAVTALLHGREPEVDLEPFRADRFARGRTASGARGEVAAR